MVPPARIERVLTSYGVNPTWGPMILFAARSAEVISALRNVDNLFPLKTAARCMSEGAPCCCKCTTRRWMATTAHAQVWHVVPCPIDSPLTPFFCIVKRRLTKVAAAQVTRGDLVAWVA